ncbi:MAG: DUF4238 domain-containing protein [Planctomycetes bacterium]|nr:DUF4238 domain-containing protein [Planctomycetota bacterium]
MAGHAKNHHYVASFHLAEFTLTGKKNGRLFVFDKRQRNRSPWHWQTTPDGVAKEGDFYGIAEGELANTIEGPAQRVVQAINESKQLPTSDEDLDKLFYYVGLATARIPGVRRRFSAFIDQIMKQSLQLSFGSPEGLVRLRTFCEQNEIPFPERQLLQFHDIIERNEGT